MFRDADVGSLPGHQKRTKGDCVDSLDEILRQDYVRVHVGEHRCARDGVDGGQGAVEERSSKLVASDVRKVACVHLSGDRGDPVIVAAKDDLAAAQPRPALYGVPLSHADVTTECSRNAEERDER